MITNSPKNNFGFGLILGNFTSPTDLNLIIARNSQLEIDLVTPEGLRPLKEVNINGQISVMRHFRPQVFQVCNQPNYLTIIYFYAS